MDTKDTKGRFHKGQVLLVSFVSFVVIVARGASAAAPQKEAPLKDVLTRAAAYVARFERDLATIIAEERYVQDVVGGRTPEHRELTSDVLLLRPSGSNSYVQFRDVFEVDGEIVRRRDERLLRLAANPNAVSAAQIVEESARYNIGDIQRTINVPLLPLTFLLTDNQWRFKFSIAKPGAKAASDDLPDSPHFKVTTEIWVVEYREVERRTLIRKNDGKDIPARGRFWIEPDTGRVLLSELIAEDRNVHSKIEVSYQSEPLLGLLVPVEMRETYWRTGSRSRIEGTATYGSFRRLIG
jgi:hypothetical protein